MNGKTTRSVSIVVYNGCKLSYVVLELVVCTFYLLFWLQLCFGEMDFFGLGVQYFQPLKHVIRWIILDNACEGTIQPKRSWQLLVWNTCCINILCVHDVCS